MQQSQSQVKWCARVLGRELGPMSGERLKRMFLDGEITPDDEIRRSDQTTWSSAASLAPPSKAQHLEVLEPVVSTIAPLRVPRSNSEERIALIRERARSTLPVTANTSDTGHESETIQRTVDEELIDHEDEHAKSDPSVQEPVEPAEVVAAMAATPIGKAIAASVSPPRPSRSIDGLIQGAGRAIRARTSRLSTNRSGLKDAFSELIPRQWLTPTTGVVAGCVLAVLGLFWLLSPSFQGEAFERITEVRKSVQIAMDDPATWIETMQELKPETAEIADRMESVATAENPSSQILLWATQQMEEVVSGEAMGASERLGKYDQLISEYQLMTTGPVSD